MKNPPESAKTARRQVAAVFAWAHENGLLGPVNVDVGGGPFDTATDWCAARGVENYVFDPYNRPDNHNAEVLEKLAGSADSVTLTNVLNVIPSKEERLDVLMRCRHFARNGGVLLVQVYKKPGLSKPTRTRDGWQLGKPASFYLPEVESVFPDAVLSGGFIVAHANAHADRLPRAQNADRGGAALDPQVAQAVFAAAPGRKTRLTGPEAEPVLAAYLAARGYVRDPRSPKSFISQDEREKWVLEERVLQRWSGGRGAWHKLSSTSKTGAAEKILASARATVTGDAAPVVAHAERVKKTRKAAVARRSAAAHEAATNRLALAMFSARLAPDERGALFAQGGVAPSALEAPADALVDGLSDAQIDSVLSVDTPPLFDAFDLKGWPSSFTWAEGPYDVTVTRASATRYEVEIGSTAAEGGVGFRIDPSSFAVRGASKHRGAPGGLTGAIVLTQTGPVAALSYFGVTGEKKKGVGSELVRLFCRLVHGYGLEGFVAVAVGADGRAFFERLASRGVAVRPIPGTANLLVSCAEVLTPREQMRMWNPTVSKEAQDEADALERVAASMPIDDPGRRSLHQQATSLRYHGVKFKPVEEETEDQWAKRMVEEAMRSLHGVVRWYAMILQVMASLGAKKTDGPHISFSERPGINGIFNVMRVEFECKNDAGLTEAHASGLFRAVRRYAPEDTSFVAVRAHGKENVVSVSVYEAANISKARYEVIKSISDLKNILSDEAKDDRKVRKETARYIHHASLGHGMSFLRDIINGREPPLAPDDALLFLVAYGIDVRSAIRGTPSIGRGGVVGLFGMPPTEVYVVHGNVAVFSFAVLFGSGVTRSLTSGSIYFDKCSDVVEYPVLVTIAVPVLRELATASELEIPQGGLFDIQVGRPVDAQLVERQDSSAKIQFIPAAELRLLGEDIVRGQRYDDETRKRHENLVGYIQADYDAGRDDLADEIAEIALDKVRLLLDQFPDAVLVDDPQWFHEWISSSNAVQYDEFVVGVNNDASRRHYEALEAKWRDYEDAYGGTYPAMFRARETEAIRAKLKEQGVKPWKYSRRMNRPKRRRGGR